MDDHYCLYSPEMGGYLGGCATDGRGHSWLDEAGGMRFDEDAVFVFSMLELATVYDGFLNGSPTLAYDIPCMHVLSILRIGVVLYVVPCNRSLGDKLLVDVNHLGAFPYNELELSL